MKTIKIIVEKGTDCYSSFAENVEGIYGMGDTIEEAKQSAVAAIDLLKKYNKDENIPEILKSKYKIAFDVQCK